MRGALLATAATFLGCALFFTLPDFVAAQLNKAMPYWFYESEVGHSELHVLAQQELVRYMNTRPHQGARQMCNVCKSMTHRCVAGTDDASGSGHGVGKLDHDCLLPLTCSQAERDIGGTGVLQGCVLGVMTILCVFVIPVADVNCHQVIMRLQSIPWLFCVSGK